MLTHKQLVKVAYSHGSKPEYIGRVEKETQTHLTLELLELDEKGKKQYRTLKRGFITNVSAG